MITIGAYDGVHLGHHAVIAQVRQLAAALDARSVVVTFDRHPASVVRPESAPPPADRPRPAARAPRRDRPRRHGRADLRRGPRRRVRATTSSRRCSSTGSATKAVVVGEDFHFGRHREGNVALLARARREMDFEVEPVRLVERPDGVDEPSARRPSGGRWPAARSRWPPGCSADLYEARGPVVMGDQRGRLLGFPTANVEVPNAMCLPADGVYAGWYVRPDGVRPPLRDQPRPPADVLRARRPLAARGPPARLRRRPLRRAGAGPLPGLPAQRAQVRRHRRARRAAQARRRVDPPDPRRLTAAAPADRTDR